MPIRRREGVDSLGSDHLFGRKQRLAQRVAKFRRARLGAGRHRTLGHIGRLQRLSDNDAEYVTPSDMLAELREDNKQLTASMRETHGLCEEYGDVATASLLENWIDEAERRTWFLFEAGR